MWSGIVTGMEWVKTLENLQRIHYDIHGRFFCLPYKTSEHFLWLDHAVTASITFTWRDGTAVSPYRLLGGPEGHWQDKMDRKLSEYFADIERRLNDMGRQATCAICFEHPETGTPMRFRIELDDLPMIEATRPKEDMN